MRRLYKNLLFGASTITIMPAAPVRNYVVATKLPRLTKSDRAAISKDWQAIGDDLRAVMPANGEKAQK